MTTCAYAYAIVRMLGILTNGSFPTPKYMPNGDDAKLSKLGRWWQRGADLYIGGYPGAAAWKPAGWIDLRHDVDEDTGKQLEKGCSSGSIYPAPCPRMPL